MYLNGCGCDTCGTSSSRGLGSLLDYGQGIYQPGYAIDFGIPSFPSSPFSPGGTSYGIDWGNIGREILDTVGDIGSDLVDDVASWIRQRIGQEIWERMPNESRQAAIREAWRDVQTRVVSSPATWGLVLGGGLLVYLLFFAPPPR